MLTVFFVFDGFVHFEFLPQGETVNRVYYQGVLQRLREKIRKKQTRVVAGQLMVLAPRQ